MASLTALISGVEDEQCSAVSLTALRALLTLPHVPSHHLHPLTSSLALKVRPFTMDTELLPSSSLTDGSFIVLVDHTRDLVFDIKRRYFGTEL